MKEFLPRYNPQTVEDKWWPFWEKEGLFHAQVNPEKKPFTVVIPPPNITGVLHMGHALNNTLQDIMVRYKRMKGFETLWMPGTDHAGIATQNVIEKQLAKEGKKRQDVGREEFLRRLWEWKNQYGDTIIHQLKKLGASCDWARTRFTMDEDYSRAVTHVFVELYKKGLIYQGDYIIHWCPRCQTALSDEEAEHRQIEGALYSIRYPFKKDPRKGIVVATTRPETMLGDTAVAVNPKDRRYKKFHSQILVLPLMNRDIPIIADDFVDPKFGTGAVKVTPAHDPNDFVMGKRHDLPFINILHPDGRLNQNAGEFNNLDRREGRKAVVDALKRLGLLEKIEPHSHAVGHCYRCNTIVEPYLSRQWFVKMKPLAQPAARAVRQGKIKFTPHRWTKVYLHWMDHIQDWCISRQIWWGHRIPVWYCVGDNACRLACRQPIVSETIPDRCPHCGSSNLRQDEDVLDTWFSSWLWPFATLSWPPENKDTDYFYPTSALFTASEIIFFWVARMIMAGIEFTGDIPFSEVYIHGTVRDAKGQKMSKSLGNAINPLEIIREYGADALRFSLIMNSGQDLYISKEKFEVGRNFANKIWNAARLIGLNAELKNSSLVSLTKGELKQMDMYSRWIISRFHSTLEKIERAIERFRFGEAETLLYDFFWKNFCDWYLEMIKEGFGQPRIQFVALWILRESLRVLHPFMPYVSEEIFHHMFPESGSMVRQPWPKLEKSFIDRSVEKRVSHLIDVVTVIRNIRAQWNINPQTEITAILSVESPAELNFFKKNAPVMKKLVNAKELNLTDEILKLEESASAIAGPVRIIVPLKGTIDIQKEKERIKDQMSQQNTLYQNLSLRLANKEFLKKAPPDVVDKEKERLQILKSKLQEYQRVLQDLS